MKKILIIYNDPLFTEFAGDYFRIKDFNVFTSNNGIEGIKAAKKERPDLIIVDKNMKGIDLKGFLVKKNIMPYLKETPIFLIGDFVSGEIQMYKNENIKAFISIPINPHSLLERLYLFFKMPLPEIKKSTPMLVDMHIKENIIIVQIEGNLEPDKLELLNYEIRCYCARKGINSPKILFIIPSLYPESVIKENLALLFKMTEFPELDVPDQNIKLLSQNHPLLELIKNDPAYSRFEVVANFVDGIQKLNLDIDNKKIIPVMHLKENASYIYDLFDDTGTVRIPALTKVTQNMIDYLLGSGEKSLTYYSESNLQEIEGQEVISRVKADKNFESITSDYKTLDEGIDILTNIEDKQILFFKKLSSNRILVISDNNPNKEIIDNALKQYVNIDHFHSGQDISSIDIKQYILIFIDIDIRNPTAIEILKKIREQSSRRQTSVIITASKIGRETIVKLKNYGTDNILLWPFSANKVLKKVFESVSSDRNS